MQEPSSTLGGLPEPVVLGGYLRVHCRQHLHSHLSRVSLGVEDLVALQIRVVLQLGLVPGLIILIIFEQRWDAIGDRVLDAVGIGQRRVIDSNALHDLSGWDPAATCPLHTLSRAPCAPPERCLGAWQAARRRGGLSTARTTMRATR